MATAAIEWPLGKSELALRIRDYDWSVTPLGPISNWPPSLRTAVDLCLGSPFPGAVLWGSDLLMVPNDAFLSIIGAAWLDVLGRPASSVRAGNWSMFGPRAAEVLATDQGLLSPDIVTTLDQEGQPQTAHFAVSFSPIHDEAGRTAGVLITAIETTDRLQTVEALHASEERARAIVEETTDYAIFTTGATQRIEDWYPGAEAVFGWSAREAVGQPYALTFTLEDRAAGVPEWEFREARRSGSAPDVRWHQRKNGSRVFIEGVVRARFDPTGAFLGILKIGRDVTARRLDEQERADVQDQTRRGLQTQVAATATELRNLSRKLLTVQEEERRYLARELHDEIGQVLTGLGLTLGTGEATTKESLQEARRIVAELTEQVRQLSMDLRPAALDAYGLLASLRWHLERYQRRTGIQVDLRYEGLERRFPPLIEITAYRIIQEALTNVARHSGAQTATIQALADADTLTIAIRDDGRGIDSSKVMGTGLAGMRERVTLLGGTFEVDSAPGAGTAITAELPFDSQATDPDTP